MQERFNSFNVLRLFTLCQNLPSKHLVPLLTQCTCDDNCGSFYQANSPNLVVFAERNVCSTNTTGLGQPCRSISWSESKGDFILCLKYKTELVLHVQCGWYVSHFMSCVGQTDFVLNVKTANWFIKIKINYCSLFEINLFGSTLTASMEDFYIPLKFTTKNQQVLHILSEIIFYSLSFKPIFFKYLAIF